MKLPINVFVTAAMLSSSSFHVSAQKSTNRGRAKKFDVTNLTADVDLCIDGEQDCPQFKCNLNPSKGPSNSRWCRSDTGAATMTVVDADCPRNLFGGSSNQGCTAASIVDESTGRVYSVNPSGDVEVIEQADFPDEEHAPNEDEPPENYSERRSLRAVPKQQERSLQEVPKIGVLVVYTQGAKADDSFGIVNRINLAIAETNQAYLNSGVNAELYLADVHEDTSGYTADQGSTSMSPSLYHLTYKAGNANDPDGLLDYIHDLRIEKGADMVALITTGAGCGIAWLSGNCPTCTPSKSWMFSVTKWSCATGYFSFGHELGHNMGAHHDRGTTNTCGNSDYRYGFRDPNGQYRSILSYSCAKGQCDNNPGGPCTRSQFFSHPSSTGWNGNRAGYAAGESIGETNNAKRINDSAPVIAAFYDTPGPTNPPTPPPTNPPTFPQPTPAPTTAAPTNPPTLPPTVNCEALSLKNQCNNFSYCVWSGNPNTGSCGFNSVNPPPTPPPTVDPNAPPTTSSPTSSCPVCSYSVTGYCCGVCVDSGKPSNRGCF